MTLKYEIIRWAGLLSYHRHGQYHRLGGAAIITQDIQHSLWFKYGVFFK